MIFISLCLVVFTLWTEELIPQVIGSWFWHPIPLEVFEMLHLRVWVATPSLVAFVILLLGVVMKD